jgi:hypothetical protein
MNAKVGRGVAIDVATGIDRRVRRKARLSAFFITGADCRVCGLQVPY